MAKAGTFAASPAQFCPSEATPQNCWSGRWKVSRESTLAGGREVVVVAIVVTVTTGVDVGAAVLPVEDAPVVAACFMAGTCKPLLLNTACGRVSADCTCAEKRAVNISSSRIRPSAIKPTLTARGDSRLERVRRG